MTKPCKPVNVRLIVAISLVVAVAAVVIVGVILLDSPAQERLRRLDKRRVSDLREIVYALDAYWTREGMLPPSLEELSNEERIVRELADPETGAAYEYRVRGDDSYELCAIFASEMDVRSRDVPYEHLWSHGPGRQCFQLTAQDVKRDPDR